MLSNEDPGQCFQLFSDASRDTSPAGLQQKLYPPVSFKNPCLTGHNALHAEARRAFIHPPTAIRASALHTLSMKEGDKLARFEEGEGTRGPRLRSLVTQPRAEHHSGVISTPSRRACPRKLVYILYDSNAMNAWDLKCTVACQIYDL